MSFFLFLLRRFVRRGGIWTGFAGHICCVGLQRHVNHVFHLVSTRIHPCVQKKEHTGYCNIKNGGLQMYGWEHIGRHGESEYVALTIAIQTPGWWMCVWEANTWNGEWVWVWLCDRGMYIHDQLHLVADTWCFNNWIWFRRLQNVQYLPYSPALFEVV